MIKGLFYTGFVMTGNGNSHRNRDSLKSE